MSSKKVAKISKKQEINQIHDKDSTKSPHDTSSVKTMPKCTCYDENQNKTRTNQNAKYPQNYSNVLEKCTCSNPTQSNPYQFRKVLSSNKTYNYTSKLPEERQSNKNQTPCYCYKGNRCYCCFDSTDNEEANDSGYNNVQMNPRSNTVPESSRVRNQKEVNDNGYANIQMNPRSNTAPESSRVHNQKETTPQTKTCDCECGCYGRGKKQNKGTDESGGEKTGKMRGKSTCRPDCKCQLDDDEFILFVKDQEGKKGAPQRNKGATGNRSDLEYNEPRPGQAYKHTARSSRNNTDVERTTDTEYNSHQRRTPGRYAGNRDRSNSELSLSSSRNMSQEEIDDINKFRDKYYFECHAIPKEQYQKRNRGRARSEHQRRSESYKPRDKDCYYSCQASHDDRRHPREVPDMSRPSMERGGNHCRCHSCVCDKKPYRLDDYGTRNYDGSDEEYARGNLPYESKKALSKINEEVAPNYTINIPEICFKFPINGGKIVIENQGDDPKSARSQSVKNDLHNNYEQDLTSLSLRQEQGYRYP